MSEKTIEPIIVYNFICNGKNIRARVPLVFNVEYVYCDGEHWYKTSLAPIDFTSSLMEYAIETLKISILEEIEFLWDNYACARDDSLTQDALELKRRLLNLFEEH